MILTEDVEFIPVQHDTPLFCALLRWHVRFCSKRLLVNLVTEHLITSVQKGDTWTRGISFPVNFPENARSRFCNILIWMLPQAPKCLNGWWDSFYECPARSIKRQHPQGLCNCKYLIFLLIWLQRVNDNWNASIQSNLEKIKTKEVVLVKYNCKTETETKTETKPWTCSQSTAVPLLSQLACLLLLSLTASWLIPSTTSITENPRYALELDFVAFSSSWITNLMCSEMLKEPHINYPPNCYPCKN